MYTKNIKNNLSIVFNSNSKILSRNDQKKSVKSSKIFMFNSKFPAIYVTGIKKIKIFIIFFFEIGFSENIG